jgi:nucleoside-diphosphate-sugar epimerase
VLLVGCGYTGRSLCRRLVHEGKRVVATATQWKKATGIEEMGASFMPWRWGMPWTGPRARTLYVLAPPDADAEPGLIARNAARLVEESGARRVIAVISTAVYGSHAGWITERTLPTLPTVGGKRQRRWFAFEAAMHGLRKKNRFVVAVRTPAIYGPGRAFESALTAKEARAIRPAPSTSRIHVVDLTSALLALDRPSPPPIFLACDDEPAPTWKVMGEAARLLNLPAPRIISPDKAPSFFSPLGLEMRLSGRRCRSVIRPLLNLKLTYPTYREGLKATLDP